MPLYRFHLSVPAPPDVVAERVRSVVGKSASFWEIMSSSWKAPRPTGLPFLGSVEGLTFRIRRNIQYRNSFLPLIRGKIVPTANGSQVNVFMFMHPFSLIFMLIWFGFLAIAESRVADANIARSFVPLGMIIFGLVMSLGGFFFEALKVMPLLSEAVFNPAITVVPSSVPEPPRGKGEIFPEAKQSAGRIATVAMVALVFLAGLVAVNLYSHRLRTSPAFVTAMDPVLRSGAAKAALGEPIKAGYAVRGMLQDNSESGYAILAIPVTGSIGKGMVYSVANRVAGGWDLLRLVLQVDGPTGRIDLTPPTQPESFHYPAPGRVYVLPLDDTASANLTELPQYYKARLGLDVIVLPTQQLTPDILDSNAKQVIAESVLDTILLNHPEIATDLSAVMLAVTSKDMNIRSSGWSYATNYRHGRFGVISTARFHGLPWFAGKNPEVFAVRVQKMLTKNLALLRYPVAISSDPTSALAFSTFTTSDADEIGERFAGESGRAHARGAEAPCVNISNGPNDQQSWSLDCMDDPPGDSRFEIFETYTGLPLFVASRADFSFSDEPSFPFIRKYRPQDDRSRSFGIGATNSFDIFPVGDSQTFSSIELIVASGGRIHFDRTSQGEGVENAKFSSRSYMGSPFSLSSLAWNGNGWDLATKDGWTYQFPSSGPGHTPQQSALIGMHSASGKKFLIQRGNTGDLREVRSPGGGSIQFTCDSKDRITSAAESSGRTVQYEYDATGRLTHIRDSKNGDEFYEYDPANRMTSVLDAQHRPLLANTYGHLGEIRSQTLADGSKLLYESGYDENHRLDDIKITLPNGYVIEWLLTRNGFVRSWPELSAHPATTSP